MKKIVFILGIFLSIGVSAQISFFETETEASLTREGNTAYNNEQYGDAELSYRASMRKNENEDMFETVFNLGNALFNQERYEEAIEVFSQASKKAEDNKTNKAKAFHNLGSAYLMQTIQTEKGEDLQKSIEAYKQALRLNPKDMDTKYNLSLAMDLLKQAQQEQQEQDKQCNNPQENEDGEKKEDQEKKENQEQNQENQEQQEQQEKQEQEKSEEEKEQEQKEKQESEKKEGEEEQKPKPEEQQPNPEEAQDSTGMGQPEERELSREEMLRLLEALKNEELKVQEKLRTQKGKTIKSDKDW